MHYNDIFISTQDNFNLNALKRAFIYFDSLNKNINLKIQKYSYSIYNSYILDSKPSYQYFQICQGNNRTPKELYFYINNNEKTNFEIFISVFGNYDSYFINKVQIKKLIDFDFYKLKEKETNFIQIFDENEEGYLKIQCEKPAMIKHSFISINYNKNLISGKRYYISKEDAKYDMTIEEKYINKTIPLKFSLLGCKNNSSIELYLNEELIILNNTSPIELEFKYEKYISDLIKFKIPEDIDNSIKIELIVGFLKEDLESYKQIDFVDSLGNLNIEPKKGVLIKIPKEFSEDLYDYSIIVPYFIYYLDVQICYDKIQYIVPNIRNVNEFFPIIPLFNTNPYLTIQNESNDNKFFFILIYNELTYENIIYIKKPKIFSEINLSTLNKLPQLKNENKKYFYKIVVPKGEYNFLLVKYSNSMEGTNNKVNFAISLIQKNNQFCFDYYYNNFINIPIDITDMNEDNIYLNFYGTHLTEGYINFIPSNKLIPTSYIDKFKFNMKVEQIHNNNNKLKIQINSFSYYHGQIPCKYYILINTSLEYYKLNVIIHSIIYNNNKNQKKIMLVFDDDGLKEKIEFEINIPIRLNSFNNITIIPVSKELLVHEEFMDTSNFNFTNIKKSSNPTLIIILSIIGVLSLIIIIIIIFYIRRCKKSNNNNILKEKIIGKEIGQIELN